jgi:urease accessory protein
MRTDTATATTDGALPLLRLMQLVSPSRPVGAFAYSQGIEWAVEAGWIRAGQDLEGWLRDQLRQSLARVDLPLQLRMQTAAGAEDLEAMTGWIDWLLACRETAELRLEETNRGRAFADLLAAWGLLHTNAARDPSRWKAALARSEAAGIAFAAAAWQVPVRDTLLGYAWTWLENLVMAGVKIIPLGQTQGQQILQRLSAQVPGLIAEALGMGDDEIGASSPALAIASSAHETQYTRLFRS